MPEVSAANYIRRLGTRTLQVVFAWNLKAVALLLPFVVALIFEVHYGLLHAENFQGTLLSQLIIVAATMFFSAVPALGHAVLWLDRERAAQIDELRDEIPERLAIQINTTSVLLHYANWRASSFQLELTVKTGSSRATVNGRWYLRSNSPAFRIKAFESFFGSGHNGDQVVLQEHDSREGRLQFNLSALDPQTTREELGAMSWNLEWSDAHGVRETQIATSDISVSTVGSPRPR